jgi:hypothetical protein
MNRRAFLATLGAAAAAPVVPAMAAQTVPTRNVLLCAGSLISIGGFNCRHQWQIKGDVVNIPTLPIHKYKQKWPNL